MRKSLKEVQLEAYRQHLSEGTSSSIPLKSRNVAEQNSLFPIHSTSFYDPSAYTLGSTERLESSNHRNTADENTYRSTAEERPESPVYGNYYRSNATEDTYGNTAKERPESPVYENYYRSNATEDTYGYTAKEKPELPEYGNYYSNFESPIYGNTAAARSKESVSPSTTRSTLFDNRSRSPSPPAEEERNLLRKK